MLFVVGSFLVVHTFYLEWAIGSWQRNQQPEIAGDFCQENKAKESGQGHT